MNNQYHMFPNYVIALIAIAFLVFTVVNILVKGPKVQSRYGGKIIYVVAVFLTVLLLCMSVYGIIVNKSISEIQMIIENYFR